MYKKRKKGDRLTMARHSSPRIHPGAFWRDPGKTVYNLHVSQAGWNPFLGFRPFDQAS
jgi:hypothetical protein